MPDPLALDFRGQTAGTGPARVGTLNAGLFFSKIGPDLAGGGGDSARSNGGSYGKSGACRFRGQIYANVHTQGVADGGNIRVFDEGGGNIWRTGVSAKGGRGFVSGINDFDLLMGPGGLHVIVTENQDYLVGVTVSNAAADYVFWRYDPDAGINGTWSLHLDADPSANSGSPKTFVHDGLLHVRPAQDAAGQSANGVVSYDPITESTITYANPSATLRRGGNFFTLYGRLFYCASHVQNVATFAPQIEEFVLGAWQVVSTAADFGSVSSADRHTEACWQISPDLVLMIGCGNGNASEELRAWSFETAGNSPTGALVVTNRSSILPDALTSVGGAPLPTPADYRCSGYTNTSDVGGQKKHYMWFSTNGLGPTVANLFEITDEVTALIDLGVTDVDSDFCFPENFYGGGEYENGIDGSTRLVTCSPRGWSADTTGLRVRVGAHGDAMVLAYHNKLGAVFAAGETITGDSSGETATIVGGEAGAEGLYLRDATGPFDPDEGITSSGGGTADLNTVLNYTGEANGPFQVGEVVSSSGTGVGTVTHLGLGGAGETLIKVELTAGVFLDTETISGATSLATATLAGAPSGSHGGAADKTIRARYFFSATGPTGKGIPITGFCTMVAGSGFKGTVSKGSGPGGSDELVNVVADGSVGGDTPPSFEWDFLADGVPKFLVSSLAFEIDRV